MFMEEEQETISEVAEYSPKSEFSKPRIVERAITMCIESRGKEMKAGYYNYKIVKSGEPIKIWIEDSRQVYIGKVEALKLLLSPEIRNNSDTKKIMESYSEKIELIFNKYCYEEYKMERKERLIWSQTGNKIIPELDDEVIVMDLKGNNKKGIIIKGAWNLKVNLYWNSLVKIYDEIFGKLNNLVNDLNYFKQASSF